MRARRRSEIRRPLKEQSAAPHVGMMAPPGRDVVCAFARLLGRLAAAESPRN